jgi:hypothetical protein
VSFAPTIGDTALETRATSLLESEQPNENAGTVGEETADPALKGPPGVPMLRDELAPNGFSGFPVGAAALKMFVPNPNGGELNEKGAEEVFIAETGAAAVNFKLDVLTTAGEGVATVTGCTDGAIACGGFAFATTKAGRIAGTG